MNIVNKVTLKTLKKNRTRTIVTIIGVILSAAMITAVTTFISSMQALMVNSVIGKAGPWQASINAVPWSVARNESGNEKLEITGLRHETGYAALEGSLNPNKPYLYIDELDASAIELYGIQTLTGRLPQSPEELAVPEHASTNGGVELKVGDTLTLEIGDRYLVGEEASGKLGQNNPCLPDEFPEELKVRGTRTYTIVGIIRRPDYEGYSAPGYTAVSALDTAALSDSDPVTLAFTAKNARDAAKLPEALLAEHGLDTSAYSLHNDLLDYMGVGVRAGFNAILYSMGAILIALIMIGSISLIYNAFAISVSERFKQFGMLAGVGATSRQIRNSLFFEAGFISIIGIPLGILSGIGGIGVTLYLLKDVFRSFFNGSAQAVDFTLSVSVPAVITAAAVGFLTVLISAWIPARRAARVSPIEAIRQTGEVRIRGKQVKTSRLTRKLFGIEGDLAMKNFKRNRRRYRATVFSLVISIVLFLSASTFSLYMHEGTTGAYDAPNYDLAVGLHSFEEEKQSQIVNAITALDGVEDWSVVRSANGFADLPASLIRSDLLKGDEPLIRTNDDGTATLNYTAFAVGEKTFRTYLDKLGLKEADYTDPAHPRGIVLVKQRYFDENGQLQIDRLLTGLPKEPVTLYGSSQADESGENPGETGKAVLALTAIAGEAPLGVDEYQGIPSTFSVILSDEVFDARFGAFKGDARSSDILVLAADKAGALEKKIDQTIQGMGYAGVSTYNVQEMVQLNRNLVLVVNVFSYGFIVLISLITVANVFNTISTNVNLRRREFAMLKSVGMTDGGFNRMINFECLFYGLKALLYGLPLSLLVAWLIYRSMIQGIGMAFHIPWMHVLFCVAGVFLIVFITMMYAMSKVRKENIVDALKNENL